MVSPSPIRHCAMVLCFGAAVALGSAAWRAPRSPVPVVDWQPVPLMQFTNLLEYSPLGAIAQQTRIVIRLDRRELELHQGDTVLHRFPVAIGQDDWETPVGYFQVLDLRKDPVWLHPITGDAIGSGPNNPLGSRWVGFAQTGEGYWVGIHGTPDAELMGQAVSHGCVRMRNDDIETLFPHLGIGTPIAVVPQ